MRERPMDREEVNSVMQAYREGGADAAVRHLRRLGLGPGEFSQALARYVAEDDGSDSTIAGG